jgi:hypothetical protein
MNAQCPACSYSGKIFPQNIVYNADRTQSIKCPQCQHLFLYGENSKNKSRARSQNDNPLTSQSASKGITPQNAASTKVPQHHPETSHASPKKTCKDHPSIMAMWQCQSCHNYFCDQCIIVRKLGIAQAEVCKVCKGMCVSLTPEERGIQPEPFSKQLLSSFSYPFKGEGVIILIAGGIFFWILEFIASRSIFGIIIAIFLSGYIAAYMLKVINSSGNGDDELPDWPEFYDFWNTIFRPLFFVFGTGAFCFAPVVFHAVYSISMGWSVTDLYTDPLWWGLITLGFLYFPMGMLAVAMFDNAAALNPLLVVPSIVRVFPQYLIACTIFALTYILSFIGNPLDFLPFLGPLLSVVLSLYFLMVEMRILGIIYHANQERLGWF